MFKLIRNYIRWIMAIEIAIREVMLGQRTAVCRKCGYLADAEIQICPYCSIELYENPHPADYDGSIPWDEINESDREE